MTTTVETEVAEPGDALSVLADVREARAVADAAEARLLRGVVQWVVLHPPTPVDMTAGRVLPGAMTTDPTVETLGAEGVPEVAAGAVAELGVALRMSPGSIQQLVADAVELASRLPTIWLRVLANEVQVWRARKIAQATRSLPSAGAELVDRQLAAVAHRCSFAQLDRLVTEALVKVDPERAAVADAHARDNRRFDVWLADTTLGGVTPVAGVLELSDALDLDAAIRHGAAQLRAWGNAENDDACRARALGDLARQHLVWHDEPAVGGTVVQLATDADSSTGRFGDATVSLVTRTREAAVGSGERAGAVLGGAPSGGRAVDTGPSRRVPPPRQVVLYVHLTDRALATATSCRATPDLGRVENTKAPVTAEAIRRWCGAEGTRLVVRPVLDLDAPIYTDAYEIPDRLREQIRLRDGTCVFPGCAVRGLSCQVDHIVPFDHEDPRSGGQTETANLALLCPRHHGYKTHLPGWGYAMTAPGVFRWTTPIGIRVTRDTATTRAPDVPPPGLGPATPDRDDHESGAPDPPET